MQMPFKTLQAQETERIQDYILPLLLVFLILCPSALFAWMSFHYTVELREENTLARNTAIAQLSARLIDAQWDSALLVLQALEKRKSLLEALSRKNRRIVGQELKASVDLVPDLLFIAVYQPNGALIANYPAAPKPVEHAAGTDWFRHLSSGAHVYVSGVKHVFASNGQYISDAQSSSSVNTTDAIALAITVDVDHRACGYLLAYYRLGEIDTWLQHLNVSDGSKLFVVDTVGNVITSAGSPHGSLLRFEGLPAFQKAIHKHTGAINSHKTEEMPGELIGYAFARKPGWVVLVDQPTVQALAPINILGHRLLLLVIPIILLMFVGAGALAHLYRRANRMTRQLARQNVELIQANRAKSDFFANVSHGLRTPLASIRISLSGLLDPNMEWGREEIQENLRLASDGLDQITARVRNLLDMARLESGAYAMHLEPADLTDIVGAALESVKPVLLKRVIHTDFPGEPLLVECDLAQLQTVVVNLIENAVKYSPPDSPLTLCGFASSESVEFTITDTGLGVVAGDEALVFEKFYRSPTSKAIGGTGLGLAICKSTIEAHGGSIGVRAVPEGCQFWFLLPKLKFVEKSVT